MEPIERSIPTRFRAYQIGSEGASFSYFANNHFTLIEGRINDTNRSSIYAEMGVCGKKQIDTLHITSWDQDHCTNSELEEILVNLKPNRIEYPGYPPETDNAKTCLALIRDYRERKKLRAVKIDPAFIDSLGAASALAYKNVFYGPIVITDNPNDNSTIKFFRSGSFSVLSLGDVEDQNISSFIRRRKFVKNEADVLILPHHGANNGFLTNAFLKAVRPGVAVCSSNYNNKFDHPKPEVRNMLRDRKVPLYTTKTGDVIIQSCAENHRQYDVFNLGTNNADVNDTLRRATKKGGFFARLGTDSYKNYVKGNKKY